MPHVRSRYLYQHVYDFDKGRIVAYRDCGLSYRNIAARVTVVGIDGLPSEAEEENCDLIVLDDMMNDVTSEISQMFTMGSHHKKYSIILIAQNLFPRVKSMRDISLNAHYIILFRNNRDVSQAACFGRQAFPGRGKFFMDSYKKATEEPFSYLLVDVHLRLPEVQRLRKSLFPDHGMINWVFVPNEK
ncbi:uncharacterized protein TNCV_4312571 [Trichonephila clavipes]|nr:uncharacterized protein TNCV_4312571 [Trichonephila clavipes]